MTDTCIALIGNPNSGKTTLFNVLTGTHQKVGNWPGVTVEKKTGRINLGDEFAELVDLPGIYSLEQEYQGFDEQIARNYLETAHIDLVINIVDCSNLQRNLVLTEQLIELKKTMIVVLNMVDVAEQQGIEVDAGELEQRLGIPVVKAVASQKRGIDHLRGHIAQQLDPFTRQQATAEKLDVDNLDGNEKIIQRYRQVEALTDGVVKVDLAISPLTDKVDRWVLNRWLGIPVFLMMMYLLFTLAINVGAIFIDFFDILFNAVFVETVAWLLSLVSAPDWLITLIANGVGGGITLVSTFVPVIACLYLGLSILEDSGYMSRAAFVVDRFMAGIGLPGNAFVPLIVGFGCNVPAVMAARSLGRESDRLMTIAMAPFMSCGARLTVYTLFAAAFFPEQGQNIVFALYLMGIVVAVLTGFIFRKQLFAKENTPSLQEMPAYHKPVLRNIVMTTWLRLKGFIVRAGKAIVAVVVVLSFLNSIGTDGSYGNEDSSGSVLSAIGKTITPAFEPIGVAEDNWPATVGLFTGMFAKEAIVGTLDALYVESDGVDDEEGAPDLLGAVAEAVGSVVDATADLGAALTNPLGIVIGDISDESLIAEEQDVQQGTLSSMQILFGSSLAAFTYLVFILLYAPCVAVVGAMVRESGWRYAGLVFLWSTTVAYYVAGVIYQLGSFAQQPTYALTFIAAATAIMALFIVNLKKLGRKAIQEGLIPTITVD